MEVTVKLHADFKDQVGTGAIRISIDEDETIDTLLMKLSRRYPRLIEMVLDPTTGEVRENYDILINGQRIQRIRGMHTKLKHKDEIVISPPAAEGDTPE